MTQQKIKRQQRNRHDKNKNEKIKIQLLLSLLLIGAVGVIFKLNHQMTNLRYTKQTVQTFEAETISPLETWHSQEVKFVYLTFDDGPTENTETIMSLLKSYDIDATFFLTGTAMQTYSEAETLLPKLLKEGHYLGIKGMSQNYNDLYVEPSAAKTFTNSMLDSQALLAKLTDGFVSNLCRAPYSTLQTFSQAHVQALQANQLKCWDWDIDTNDWSNHYDAKRILEKVKTEVELLQHPNHLVILLHEYDKTIEVLPQLIQYLKNEGYEFLPYHPSRHQVKNFYGSDEL